MTEASLYERLGGAFAIAARRLTISAMRWCRTRSLASNRRTQPSENGTPTIWADFRASSSCAPCGSATCRVVPSSTRPPNRAVLLLVWKKPIVNYGFRRRSSTKSPLNLAERSTTSRCQSTRRARYSLRSPRTRAKSPRAIRPPPRPVPNDPTVDLEILRVSLRARADRR